MSLTRPHPAAVKVVCVGLGRTGTASLRLALEALGFGPCYHVFVILESGGKDFAAWHKISEGDAPPEAFDKLLRCYTSIISPAAIHAAEMYAAYPDAKFILTTRDPAEWEKSFKSTVLRSLEIIREMPNRSPLQESLMNWHETCVQKRYHRGRIYTHSQQEILDHNERVKKIIPPETLLVWEPSEGWDRLVEFLGVPKPDEPFPHVNNTAQFRDVMLRNLEVIKETHVW